MKRMKRGLESSHRRKPDANQCSTDHLPSCFTRNTKRKLVETEVNNGSKKRICTGDPFSDNSDCIIIDEIITAKAQPEPDIIVTSTPVKNRNKQNPAFDGSSIKTSEHLKVNNDSNDVIIISDSSKSTLPSVVVTEEVKSDDEVQIIPSASGHIFHRKRKNKRKNYFKKWKRKKNKGVLKLANNLQAAFANNFFGCGNIRSANDFIPLSGGIENQETALQGYNCLVHPNSCANVAPNNLQTEIGKNIFVESSTTLPQIGLRPIIIDGSNVAFHHSNNRFFSCKGLEICIKYFKIRGHEVIAFVPQYRTKIDKSDNPRLLEHLVKQGDVVLTPSREIDGQPIVSYDDRFIVQTAVVKGGVIVTRDNYRDLLLENPAWAETIKYRLLQFTWVKDILIFPNDPLGARGPSLEDFLKFC